MLTSRIKKIEQEIKQMKCSHIYHDMKISKFSSASVGYNIKEHCLLCDFEKNISSTPEQAKIINSLFCSVNSEK